MTLKYLVDVIKNIALLQPNVRTATEGDIYDTLNANPNVKYSVFHITQNAHREQDNINYYSFNFFYVDRLLNDNSNKLQIQSVGKELISNILKTLDETFETETSNITFQPFTERFNDTCAGVYANVTISCVEDVSCAEQYGEYIKPTIQVINNEDITITDNGTYYPQNGFSGFGKVEVKVDVEEFYERGFEQGKEEQKSLIQPITITQNGEYVNENGYSPINVNLDLESIYEEGVVNGREEQKSLLTSITITENGEYTNENGYNEVIVNVDGTPKPKLPNGICLEQSTFSTIDMSKQDWGNVYDWKRMFWNCVNLTEIQNFPTNVEILNADNMFYYCEKLTEIPELNTSNCNDMSWMFCKCSKLTSIPQIDTSNVLYMREMFSYCENLTSIPQIDTSNCINMREMFRGCSNLISIPQIDTSNVTDMSWMFGYCRNLEEVKFKGNPQYLTNVNNVNNMFLETGKNVDNPKMYYPREFETNYQKIINLLPNNWTAVPY